ncbi:MAG: glycosyltransferase family 4 protein [bacterium]
MGKKRILYFNHYSDIVGGGEVSLVNLIGGLNRSSYEPIVVTPYRGTLAEAVESAGASFAPFGTTERIISASAENPPRGPLELASVGLDLASLTLRLRRLIKEEEIDLAHLNGFKSCILAGAAAKLAGIPVVYHDRIAARHGPLDSYAARLADRIIAISRKVAGKYGIKSMRKVKIIPNGVDLSRFNYNIIDNTLRAEMGVSPGETVVGTVGQLIPWKGQRYFIEAATIIKDKYPNTKFLVVGDLHPRAEESYKRELKELSEGLGLENDVIFAGFRKDVERVLSIMDVFVLPSVEEPFGRVVIEAMAMAKPVVATDDGGAAEIVLHGETGFLVPSRDPKALAEATLKILEDRPAAQRMGALGRRRVEENFSIERNVRETEAVYEELLR